MMRMLPEEIAAGLTIVVMVLMVAVQVACRYVFHISLSYTEELVRYLFVWTTFLGAAAAVRKRRHLTVFSGGSDRSPVFRRVAGAAVAAGSFLFIGTLVFWGARVVILQKTTGQTTAALGLPMWIVGLAVPAGALLIAFRILQVIGENKGKR